MSILKYIFTPCSPTFFVRYVFGLNTFLAGFLSRAPAVFSSNFADLDSLIIIQQMFFGKYLIDYLESCLDELVHESDNQCKIDGKTNYEKQPMNNQSKNRHQAAMLGMATASGQRGYNQRDGPAQMMSGYGDGNINMPRPPTSRQNFDGPRDGGQRYRSNGQRSDFAPYTMRPPPPMHMQDSNFPMHRMNYGPPPPPPPYGPPPPHFRQW